MATIDNESISKFESGGRSGACSGVVYSTTNSRSLSKVTKTSNSLLSSHVNGVGVNCSYENKNGDIKSYSSVYNDLLRQWMDHGGKCSRLLNDKTFIACYHIKKMCSCLNAYIMIVRSRHVRS